MQKLLLSVRVFIIMALLCGLFYPLFIVSISNIFFPFQAQGSLLKSDNKIIGSKLIAQQFTSHAYFHSRFSTANYNATDSGASNLAASNKQLLIQTGERIRLIREKNNISKNISLPADMVLNSASGLDPHISLENANLQLVRIAKYRHLAPDKLKQLIYQNIDFDFIGIWGQRGVNVLKLNLALDSINK